MATPTTIIGNITNEELELRQTPNGKAVINLGIAVNSGVRQADGSWKDSVEYFDVVAWERLAENIYESFAKGTRVIVTGNLKQNRWNAPDGTKRSRVELVAKEVGASVRWATSEVTRNAKATAEEADEAGESTDYTAAEPF